MGLDFKVHDPEGDLIAALEHASDAAAVVACHGEGSTIRTPRGKVLWHEGREEVEAGESYDEVAEACHERKNGRRWCRT